MTNLLFSHPLLFIYNALDYYSVNWGSVVNSSGALKKLSENMGSMGSMGNVGNNTQPTQSTHSTQSPQ